MKGIIALIPARSGSKSVRNKNLREVQGKPLLVHAIEHAKSCTLIDRIIVSTDSEDYAAIARNAGAEVPFLRPEEFSQDTSTDLDVFQHALSWLKENESTIPDICVHLRPTYPFRHTKDINAVIRLLIENSEFDSVRSIALAPEPPFKMWFHNDDKSLTPVVQTKIKDAHSLPRQVLPKAYLQNACIDAVRSDVILSKGSMTGDKIYGYVMEENFDIDTHADLMRAGASIHQAPPIAEGDTRTFCFDIDGVIASISSGNDYALAEPQREMIEVIRRLHDHGHRIILHTARGTMTGKDWREVTEKQMKEWDVPYDELHFGKPAADYYVDDRALPVDSLQDSSPILL